MRRESEHHDDARGRAEAALARALRVPPQDVPILNFLLLVEHLEAAFYREAAARARQPARGPRPRLNGELLRFAEVVGAHERAHVAFLRELLGRRARRRPVFAFGRATADPRLFARTALTLADLSTGAYIGQGANVSKRSVVFVAGIASVESRHSGWLRDLLGRNPAPHPADPPSTPTDVLTTILNTGFVRRA